jgi:hypothetical protein
MSALPRIPQCHVGITVDDKSFSYALPLCDQSRNFCNCYYKEYIETRDFKTLIKSYELLQIWFIDSKKMFQPDMYNESNFFKIMHTMSIEALKYEESQSKLNTFKTFAIVNHVTSMFVETIKNEFIQKHVKDWQKKHDECGRRMEEHMKVSDFKPSDLNEAGLIIKMYPKSYAITNKPYSDIVKATEDAKTDEPKPSTDAKLKQVTESISSVIELVKLFVPREEIGEYLNWIRNCAECEPVKPLVLCGPRSRLKKMLIKAIKTMFVNMDFIWTENRKAIANEPNEILFGDYEQLITDLAKPIIQLTKDFTDQTTGHTRTITTTQERNFNMILDLGAEYTSKENAYIAHVREVGACKISNLEEFKKLISTLDRTAKQFEKEEEDEKDGSTIDKAIDLVD